MKTRLRELRDRAVVGAGRYVGLGREFVGRYPATKAVVPIVLLVLVASLVLRPTSRPGPSPTPGGSGGVAQSSPTSPAGPTGSPEPWEDLVLDPAVVVAMLTPDRESRAGVAASARFTLRSLDGTAAADLAAGIQAEPPIRFKIVAGTTPDEVTLEPRDPLLEGQTYRLQLRTPDGALGGSWAFRTQRPPRVVATLPGDLGTEVPLDTGIEITFDQDGTTGVERRFHLAPATAGRVEQHERTWAFVPDAPLKPATTYTVTLDPGVGLEGSDLTLDKGISFQFETALKATEPEVVVRFTSPLAAIRPSEQPSLPIYRGSNAEEGGAPPTDRLRVQVFRLPNLQTTLDAVDRLTGRSSWALYSAATRVPTGDLVRVAALDAPVLVDRDGATLLAIPITLDPGAYLVVLPRAESAQMVLQVTDLAVYALSTETDTVAWLNDLATVEPVAGATITSVDDRRFGVTDEAGVARFATPRQLRPQVRTPLTFDDYAEWLPPQPRLLAVTAPDGRWIVAGLGSPVSTLDGPYDNEASQAAEPYQRWWLLLNTDRDQYRETDVIHAWGLVRSRDGGSLPDGVRAALYAVDEEYGSPQSSAPIVRVPVTLNRSGAFVVDIPTASLPHSEYRLDLEVGGLQVQSTWLQVADIRKPTFSLELTTDRYAYRDGEPIEVTIQASFFDGSTVPAMDLRVKTGERERSTTVTTDRSGIARLTVRADFEGDRPGGWTDQGIFVTPARPEEGEISGSLYVVVFPSAAWLTSRSTLSGTSLQVDGTVSRVAFAAIDAANAAGSGNWTDAIAGRGLGGRDVSATVTRYRQVRRDLGTRYDYLEKKVVHVYDYHTVQETLGTYPARSADDGSFHLSVTVPSAKDGYDITLRSTDPAGRPVLADDYARRVVDPANAARPSYLLAPTGCGFFDTLEVGLDASAEVTMHDGDGRVAGAGRFLFLTGNRGLRDLSVGASPTYAHTLREDDLPGFTIRAVQVTAQGYTTADAGVRVDPEDLTVQVGLRPDHARYQPGGRVQIEVTTLGPDGRPIPADVIVQGVDEKLFAIGAAHDADVLSELYRWVGPGFLQSFASHRIPLRPIEGGCGAAGGGRESFGDVVTSQLVRTGRDGHATVSFDLLDDLTSWHMSAMAITDGLRAGRATVLIPVGLPFFVESVLAPEYLVGERPVLRVRAYGDALHAGDAVRFTVSAPSLGLAETTVDGVAFEPVRVPLPSLPEGEHRIRVEGRGPAAAMRDAVVRSVRVVPTRLVSLATTYDLLTSDYAPTGGEGLTTYAITDAGRGALLSTLVGLASTTSARFDRLAAADAARLLLISEFGFDEKELPDPRFEPGRFQRSGIALLPYASDDPELSALTALVAPDTISIGSLRGYLLGLAESDESTREMHLMALAGLAGLGDDVLDRLRASAAGDLTIRESLWLALGLEAVGDENAARTIERDLLEQHGERFGPWVRLGVGSNLEDTLNAARLLLMLSARLGEPFAKDVLRYLDDHPSSEHAIALERLAYVRAGIDRLPRAPGRFAWTVSAERHEVELKPGGTFTLVLTAPQRSTLQLEPLAGELAVVTSWTGREARLPSGGGVVIQRSISPANDASDDQLVRVEITFDLGSVPINGCWQIRDIAPSGLVPIERSWAWPDDDSVSRAGPYDIDGQVVYWCVTRDSRYRSVTYSARVVSPGTYTWEPAVMQSVDAPELGSATEAFEFTIR